MLDFLQMPASLTMWVLCADFISRQDALETVLPHILDLERPEGPGLGQIGLVQTPQIFYNRNKLVNTASVRREMLIYPSVGC